MEEPAERQLPSRSAASKTCPGVDVRRARLPAAAISLPSVRVKHALKFLTMWQKSEAVPQQQRGTVGRSVWEERRESGGSPNDEKPTESRRLKAEFTPASI